MKLPDFIQKNPAYALMRLAGLIAACFLIFALIAQYGFGLHPCELCIAQRVPYAIIMLLSIAACFGMRSPEGITKMAWLCAALFLLDGGIALYHSGVELGWITGPSGCTNHDKPGASLEEMRAAIMNAQAVPCDQPMAYVLGLSMASWNALAAFAMAGFMALGLKRHA